MKIIDFEIKNFKGINKIKLGINDDAPGNVVTLVGLNESGKTTVLEALSYFIAQDAGASALTETIQKRSNQDMVPKSKEAAFNGEISIIAKIELEESDRSTLEVFLQKRHNLTLDCGSVPKFISVNHRFDFKNSIFVSQRQWWSFAFSAVDAETNQKTYAGLEDVGDPIKEIWRSAVGEIRSHLPTIAYFPTFLFDFPDRIYLENDPTFEGAAINDYYKLVLQDVLDGLSEGISLQEHIVDRVVEARKKHPNASTFLSYFTKTDQKRLVEVVCTKISSEMTRVIFGAWSKVLGKSMADKRVEVGWNLESEENNAVFLDMSIVDGSSIFSLSERSLGFRWFFSFLLFTQFRESRASGASTIFIFDEPASNLHPKAQIKLLDSFGKIASEKTKIIYSTHSHYMINPQWLEKTYIVHNGGFDYDSAAFDMESYSSKNADIQLTKYRAFVGRYPQKTTYFQPILDALQIPVSHLERHAKAIIVEGKNDYYALSYLVCTTESIFQVFPATGAGTLGPLISLFRGWGVDIVIILDDDEPGRYAKNKYVKEYMLRPNEATTIGEICRSVKGKPFEKFYQEDLKEAARVYLERKTLRKQHYALYFQYLMSLDTETEFPETSKALNPLKDFIKNRFSG